MKKLLISMALVLPVLFMTSCSDDDDSGITIPVEVSKTYQLGSVSDPAISGTAKFIKNVDNTTTIELQLNGTTAGVQYPAHIHFNTAAESGAIALTLGTVNGDTGFSSVTTSTLMDASPITYDALLDFDGYINVHNPVPDDLSVLVAQGDIGQNELTTTSRIYSLGAVADPSISGTVTFTKRVNEETLAVIQLDGTPDGGMHPAHIHMNTAAESGAVVVSFNAVDGTTGRSVNNIAALDFGTDITADDIAITYDELLEYDGYVNVHLSADDLTTLVAQGDIGQNELTGASTTYPLASVSDPAISGDITFEKRMNGEALATIDLDGTMAGIMYPAHIHIGSVATAPGAIILDFAAVDGTNGISKTNISNLNGLIEFFGYDDALAVDGYVNVHNPMPADLSVLVAQGNIGLNN